MSAAAKVPLGGSACLVLLLLLSHLGPEEAGAVSVAGCLVNVHTLELRRYYAEIRQSAITGDSEPGVKILDRSATKDVPEEQMCCLMRLLLKFYVEMVFSKYVPSQPQLRRHSSALANAFVTIRRDMQSCLCGCSEKTQTILQSLHTRFTKLDAELAARKAVSELDVLLDWLQEME